MPHANADLPMTLDLFRLSHITAGIIAVLCFLVPLLVKKGGWWHVRSGWVFVITMGFVSLSAFLIAGWRIVADPAADFASRTYAAFLFFMALLLLSSLQQGLLALRIKQRRRANVSLRTSLLPALLTAAALGLGVFGWSAHDKLLMTFTVLGGAVGVYQSVYWLSPVRHPREWFVFHLSNMCICAATTLTAATIEVALRLYKTDFIEPLG